MPNPKKHPTNYEHSEKLTTEKHTLRKIKKGASHDTKLTLLHHNLSRPFGI